MRALRVDRWTVGAVVALVVVAGLLLAAFGWLLGPFDLQTLLHAGAQVRHGSSPYDPPTSAVFLAGHAFVYPAFVAWLFVPLAFLPAALAEALYIGASAAAVVASCTLLGRAGFTPSALILASSATIVGLQMGTVNAWLLLGLAVAWRFRERRGVLAGIVLGIAVAVKLFLLPMLAWPVIARRYGTAAAAAGTFAVLMVVSTFGGPISLGTYQHLLDKLSTDEVAQSWSLASFFQSVGAGAGLATGLAVVSAGGVLLVVWARARYLTESQIAAVALLCCLLVSPIVWSSYLLLLAFPLLLTTRTNAPLVLASAVSWAVVVPDVAPALRLVAGIVLLALVSILGAGPHLRTLAARLRRTSGRHRALASGGLAVVIVGLVIVPPDVRNPLPTLLCLVTLGAWAVQAGARRPATDPPS